MMVTIQSQQRRDTSLCERLRKTYRKTFILTDEVTEGTEISLKKTNYPKPRFKIL